MLITKLEYQKKDKDRVNVYVDNKFVAGVGVNDVIKLGIYKGQEITQEDIKKIVSESSFGKLLNTALNFLSFRPRSEWEVSFRLKKKADENEVNAVIEKLKLLGQIDDEAFCRWFIEQRSTFKQKGERAIKYELIKKGIPKEIISKIFEENLISDFELALRAVNKKFRDKPEKERVQRFLASRGFNWDVIEEVIAKVYNKKSI